MKNFIFDKITKNSIDIPNIADISFIESAVRKIYISEKVVLIFNEPEFTDFGFADLIKCMLNLVTFCSHLDH